MTDKPKSPVLKLVKSSNVNALGYNGATKTLTVQFKGDPMRTYHRQGVSEGEYRALLGEGVEGHSVGKHYASHIRGKYPHRMDEE